MKRIILAATAACALAGMSSAASGAVVLTATPGSDPYAGPPPTYDFETPAPVTGGAVRGTSPSGIAAQPFGSTGNYYTVGPSDGTPGELDLSAFGGSIGGITFIWGSVDSYNTLEVLDLLGNVIATFTGADAAVNPNGDQSSPVTNPLATLTFTGGDEFNVGGLRFSSSQNAFETDNFSIRAVPEPMTWLMMLIGFGFVGGLLRSTKRRERRIAFAM